MLKLCAVGYCKQMRTEDICNASRCSYFGVSRSATIVMAYIMKKYELSFEDALERYVPVLIFLSVQNTVYHDWFLFFVLLWNRFTGVQMANSVTV